MARLEDKSQETQESLKDLFLQGTTANLGRFAKGLADKIDSEITGVKDKLNNFKEATLAKVEEGTKKYEEAVADAKKIADYCKMEVEFGVSTTRKEIARTLAKVAGSNESLELDLEKSPLTPEQKDLVKTLHNDARINLQRGFVEQATTLLTQNKEGTISRADFIKEFSELENGAIHEQYKLRADTRLAIRTGENKKAQEETSVSDLNRAVPFGQTPPFGVDSKLVEREILIGFDDARFATSQFSRDVPRDIAKIAGVADGERDHYHDETEVKSSPEEPDIEAVVESVPEEASASEQSKPKRTTKKVTNAKNGTKTTKTRKSKTSEQ